MTAGLAIRRTAYGSADALRLEQLDFSDLADDHVLVRVRAASINAADRYLMSGQPYLMRPTTGWFAPKSKGLGQDVAGEVVAVGKNVTRLKPGDAVFGSTAEDFSREVDGAFAQYARVPERLLVAKPPNVTFEEAATVPLAGITALQGLRDAGQVKAGQHVLVNGASGGVGTFAVQLAKVLGAEVTAVCSARNVDQARQLGADHVIDYAREDVFTSAARFDVVFDNAATRKPAECLRLLKPGGRYVFVGTPQSGRVLGPFIPVMRVGLASITAPKGSLNVLTEKPTLADLEVLQKLLGSGQLRPVVEQVFPLSETAAAMRRFEQGHLRGKLVVTT